MADLDPAQTLTAARERQLATLGMRMLLDSERSAALGQAAGRPSDLPLPRVAAALTELEDLRESLAVAGRGGQLSESELVGAAELLRFGASLARASAQLQQQTERGMLRLSPEESEGIATLIGCCVELRAIAGRALREPAGVEQGSPGEALAERDDAHEQLWDWRDDEAHEPPASLREVLRLPEGLLERLDRSLDRSGEFPVIADEATPELARARNLARRSRKHAQDLADRLVKSSTMGSLLQDRFWTEREGRFVLPVRSDAWGTMTDPTAIVHAVSTRRSTLFVEPSALLSANNELARARVGVRAEEERVLRELSAAIGQVAPELVALQSIAWFVDILQASCDLCDRMSAWMPTLVAPGDPQANTVLSDLRHPSMVAAGVTVVGNDVELLPGQTLIVSGPNAGGKTVFLKALGLAVLMARAGLAIPTSQPGTVVAYQHIVTDVGDDQSIASNLSTFTAHLGHVGRALTLTAERVGFAGREPQSATAADTVTGSLAGEHGTAKSRGSGVLVLLDEIAVGTEPKQGAALAQAILLELAERGASGVVTTHYDTLKELAYRDPRFANAAVGFDVEALMPTFRVTLGVPGASAALAVAQRVGMDKHVLTRAASLLSEEDRRVDTMLQELAAKRTELQADLATAQEQLRKSRKQAEELALTQRRIADGIRGQRARAHEQATRELRDLESELRRHKRALRDARDRQPGLSSQPDQDALHEQLAPLARAAQERLDALALKASPVPGKVPRALEPGAQVYVASLGQTGEVVSVKGTRVTVQLPTLRTTVELTDLRAQPRAEDGAGAAPGGGAGAAGAPGTPSGKRKIRPAKGTPIFAAKSFAARSERDEHDRDLSGGASFERSLDNTVDLRGERADVAIARLEDFLGLAMELGEPEVHVIHGHGTGSVRKAVRGRLRDLGHVRRFAGGSLEQGGDGVTVVWLKL